MTLLFYSLWYLLAIATIWFLIRYAKRLSYWFARKPKKVVNPNKARLALIIPARNEGKTIIPLLESIKAQTYPKDLFSVHVVVKEEDDCAIDIVNEMLPNSKVYVDKLQDRKGHALDYALKEILKSGEKIDAYLFVDADCLLAPDFVEEMNNSLVNDCDIYNSRLAVKNYLQKDKGINTWASKCNGLMWPLLNEMGNQGKSNHHEVTMTTGTGLMITSKLIEEWGGWPFDKTMTEDIELQRTAILKHYKCYYNPYALVYVEEATSLKVTNVRRQRWLSGVVKCDRLFREPIDEMIEKSDSRKDKANKYASYNMYCTYWYYGTVAVIGILGLIIGTLSFFRLDFLSNFHGYRLFFTCLGIVYGSFAFTALWAVCSQGKLIKLNFFEKLHLIISFPLFQMMYYVVMFNALFRDNSCSWDEVKRVDFSSTVAADGLNRKEM